MSNQNELLVLQANIILACERANFDENTRQMVEDALNKSIEALRNRIND